MNIFNSDEQQELKETALKQVGSYPLYDTLFLVAFPIVGAISFTLNLISYHLFSAPYFTKKKPLYTFLRLYSLNSAIINLIFAFSFLLDSRRYVTFANTELATWLRCFVKIPILNLCYFFSSIMDVVFSLERYAELKMTSSTMKLNFRNINPLKLCASLFTTCFIVNLPYLFVFEPSKRLLTLNITNTMPNMTNSSSFYIYHYKETQFALTDTGIAIKNTLYGIRDVLTLVMLILINFLSIIQFRRKVRSFKETANKKGAMFRGGGIMGFVKSKTNNNSMSTPSGGGESVNLFKFTDLRSSINLQETVNHVNVMLTLFFLLGKIKKIKLN
jgi:hypothetical protein